MKNLLIAVLVTLSAIVLTSCDPEITVVRFVENNSSSEITVDLSFLSEDLNSITTISSGATQEIFTEALGGVTVRNYEHETSGFVRFVITNEEGDMITKDVLDVANWNVETLRNQSRVDATLIVEDGDF